MGRSIAISSENVAVNQSVLVTGSLGTKKRNALVEDWKINSHIRFLLMTYKVGCTGWTLIQARYMFCLSQWWSPVVIAQAIKRIHRIGQKRDCTIYHYIVPNSIETRIIEICQKKKALAEKYFGKTEKEISWQEISKMEKEHQIENVTDLMDALWDHPASTN